MDRKIACGIEAVIATGSYQNYRPSFYDEIVFKDCTLTDEEIEEKKSELYDKNFAKIKEVEMKVIKERIQREREDMRFYMHPELGIDVPSVTSVRDWDIDFFIDPVSLKQYASQSNIVHAKVEEYIDTGKWVEAKAMDRVWPDIVIVKQGHLKLPMDTGNFVGFLEKHPIREMKNGGPVFLEDSAGTPDFTGIPNGWKDAEEVETCFDVKRTPDKIKDGIQMAAYCKAMGLTQAVTVPLNGKTGQGFSKPTIYDKKTLEGYYRIYQQKRKEFRKRYDI